MPSLSKRIRISARPKTVTDAPSVYVYRNNTLFVEMGNPPQPSLKFEGGSQYDFARGAMAFGKLWWDAGTTHSATSRALAVTQRTTTLRNEPTPIGFQGYTERIRSNPRDRTTIVTVTDPIDDPSPTNNQKANVFYNLYSLLSNSTRWGDGREVTTGPVHLTNPRTNQPYTNYQNFWYQRSLGISVLMSEFDAREKNISGSEMTKLVVGDKVKFVVWNPVVKQPLQFVGTVSKGIETYDTHRQGLFQAIFEGPGIDEDLGYWGFDMNNITLLSNPDGIDDINGGFIHVGKVDGAIPVPPFAEFSSWASVGARSYNSYDVGGRGYTPGENFQNNRTFIIRVNKKLENLDISQFDVIIKFNNINHRMNSYNNLDGKFATLVCELM